MAYSKLIKVIQHFEAHFASEICWKQLDFFGQEKCNLDIDEAGLTDHGWPEMPGLWRLMAGNIIQWGDLPTTTMFTGSDKIFL